jgi:GNAT superfamily N-acetyltransferase
MWPHPDGAWRLVPVHPADFESLLALRIRAMRPSLEALGRFDPERARERLASTFASEHMHHIVRGNERLGLLTLRPTASALWMDHLYIDPAYQGQGIGAWAMDVACALADQRRLPLHLLVLKQSPAIRFYANNGLQTLREGEWDIELRREPRPEPMAVVQALWRHFQAREWRVARALLHDQAQMHWWASGESISGGDTIIAVNEEYPEGWTIHPLQFDLMQDGRAHAMVRVEHAPHNFLVRQLTRVRDGLITHIDELWAQCEAPPAWRTPERFAGLASMPGWPDA